MVVVSVKTLCTTMKWTPKSQERKFHLIKALTFSIRLLLQTYENRLFSLMKSFIQEPEWEFSNFILCAFHSEYLNVWSGVYPFIVVFGDIDRHSKRVAPRWSCIEDQFFRLWSILKSYHYVKHSRGVLSY